MEEIRSNFRYSYRWFAYFDLLGFKNKVLNHELGHVLPLYEQVLVNIKNSVGNLEVKGISYSWFSDTFIVFSRGSTEEEFHVIEKIASDFFGKLIIQGIPVRGSLTYGELYSQKQKNIFLGKALIDAYEYGERQQWLGFILTPMVYDYFNKSNPYFWRKHIENNYRDVSCEKSITHKACNNVYAFTFNDKRAEYLQSISIMKEKSGVTFHNKYDNTLSFVNGL